MTSPAGPSRFVYIMIVSPYIPHIMIVFGINPITTALNNTQHKYNFITMIKQNSSLLQNPSTTADALSVMLQKEQHVYRCNDYLAPFRGMSQDSVTPEDRAALVDWCFAIVDACNLQRETVSIAVNLLDRFMSIPSPQSLIALQDRRQIQLLAITSLYIAIKINERVAFPSNMFVILSNDGYSLQEIEETEKIILCRLGWRINGPTVLQISMHILSLMNVEGLLDEDTCYSLLNEVQYQSEVAIRDHDISISRLSTVALTILFKSFNELEAHTRLVLFTELLPLLQEFDFEKSCKKSIALGFMRSHAISRCESVRSLDKFDRDAR